MDPANNNAAMLIKHPRRVFSVGRSGYGKTTFMVKLIKFNYKNYDRIIIICPTFWHQDTFIPIRNNPKIMLRIKKDDVYTRNIKSELFKKIQTNVEKRMEIAAKLGYESERVLIFIDDLAGTSAIHNNGKGHFANLCVQTPHYNISMFVVSQQPLRVDPNFRDNCECIFVFPCDGKDEVEWLIRSYQSLAMDFIQMKEILLMAWRGSAYTTSNSEWGKHFLFILAEPRTHTRFFIDLSKEIEIIRYNDESK